MKREKEISNNILYKVRCKINSENTGLSRTGLFEAIALEAVEYKLPPRVTARISNRIFAKIKYRLGILEPYIEDESINEIMVNGPENIFIEKFGEIIKVDEVFDSVEELEDVIRKIASDVHREINEMNPIVDARLMNGSRVNGVYKNIAIGGPILTIRKFSRDRITLTEMVEHGTVSSQCAEFLKRLVESGYNIFISGGTSSGKTTFLNALSDYIPKEERVIVIEDSMELKITNIPNIVRMECRNANSMGKGSVGMDSLIKSSLRMRPDRIVVGEVRGKEVFQMIQAMNTGHKGSLSTGHGNSVMGMLRRLEAMYLMAYHIPIDAIRVQIVEALDVMVHLEKVPGGKRVVTEVVELIGYENGSYLTNPIYLMDEKMSLKPTENELVNSKYLKYREFSNNDRL